MHVFYIIIYIIMKISVTKLKKALSNAGVMKNSGKNTVWTTAVSTSSASNKTISTKATWVRSVATWVRSVATWIRSVATKVA